MVQEFKGYENLEAWKVSRELVNRIYAITKNGTVIHDYGFPDQIRRAALSVMNNIAEGYERGSTRDFVRFLYIARGSAGEVRSMLYIALDQEYITQAVFQTCYELSVRCSQLCWGLIKYNSKKRDLESRHV